MNLPDFIIVGVAKAGTTALYEYLNEHPEVYMSPIKETNYFAFEGDHTKTFLGDTPNLNFPVRSISEYQDLFRKAENEVAIGEASPIYFESKIAAYNIKNTIPNVKIIIIIRNPAERAYSDYMMALKDGIERRNIKDALTIGSHYVQVGFYFEKIKRYIDLFKKDNILIGLYDDFKNDGRIFMKKIYQFVGVESSFIPRLSVQHNVGGYPKSFLLSTILHLIRRQSIVDVAPDKLLNIGRKIKRFNTGKMREFPPEIRFSLNKLYKKDVLKVQNLIGHDLKAWL